MTEETEKKSGGDATPPAPGAAGDEKLRHALLAAALFSALAASLQFALIPYGTRSLGLSPALAACLAFLAALGIGSGKYISDRLSGRDIEFGIVPAGAFLQAAALGALALLPPRLPSAAPVIFLAGAGAGLFMAPIDSYLLRRSRADARVPGSALRAGAAGALLGAGLALLAYGLGFTAERGFAAMSLAALILAGVTLSLLPDFLARFLLLAFTRMAYKLRLSGLENVPAEGPALLVCNHISYADAIILIASQRRRLRFLINREVYEGWKLINPVFRLLRLIPVDMRDTPKKIVASLQAARKAMDEGCLVVIFAEGALTRTGMLREFRKGFTKIMKNSAHPIIPVYLGGAWGTVTSYYHGSFVKKWKGYFRHEVSVSFGRPLPASSTAAEVRLAVMELSCAYFDSKKSPRRTLGRELIKAARANWDLPVVADSAGSELTAGGLLTGALELGRGIKERTIERENVGLLLPPSAGGALANLAVTLAGRVPVNLNYLEPAAVFSATLAQCGIKTVVTSKAFLALPGRPALPAGSALYLEDLAAGQAGLFCAFKARMAPAAWLAPRQGPDDTAAIFFSSGSTGAPKGVMLSHHNLLSNIESLRIVLDLAQDDNLCSALPLFHPLGYTAALWFPVLSGAPVSYHANPLEAGAIARLARLRQATVLFATPSTLRLYTRKAKKEDFARLKLVLVGAEKLKPALAAAFEAKFGLRPLEGYGAAELAPVAALSVPHADKGDFQTGWKAGSVGLPLPGVAMKVVDPVTGAALPPGGEGILLVKGPNVMKGYLDRPDLTAEVIRDGWYRTGDLASIDEEGFVTIEDRYARFTRIGEELVPHLAVEEALQDGLGTARRVVAAASVPDGAGGEKLAVLFAAGDPARLRAIAAASALPFAWRPGENSYYKVDRIPVTGGRPDLEAINSKARALAAGLPL